MIPIRLLVIVLGVTAMLTMQAFVTAPQTSPLNPDDLIRGPLSSHDRQVVKEISTSEWLGPLAPVAISPFFGITCLAGISQFGSDYLPLNEFVSTNPVLRTPAVFWIFLVLTLLTSLPRLTKVSKPVAQALDQVEAYAGIITILILRFAVTPQVEPEVEATVVQMGILSFSTDVLFSLAAIINIVVINSIKFFFEVIVWLTPIPFVDAVLEAFNKALCAGLMAIYAWSPLVATIFNLILFAACLLAFTWVKKRVAFLRAMLIEPLWAMVFTGYARPAAELNAFTQGSVGVFSAKTPVRLIPVEDGWKLIEPRWLLADRAQELARQDYQLVMQTGLLMNSIKIVATGKLPEGQPNREGVLHFSRRFNDHLDELADQLGVARSDEKMEAAVPL